MRCAPHDPRQDAGVVSAALRVRTRRDGTLYPAVLYVIGKQTSSLFNDHAEALRFQELANRTSPAKALEVWATESPAADGFTVASWCSHHVDHLTGANDATTTTSRTATTGASSTPNTRTQNPRLTGFRSGRPARCVWDCSAKDSRRATSGSPAVPVVAARKLTRLRW